MVPKKADCFSSALGENTSEFEGQLSQLTTDLLICPGNFEAVQLYLQQDDVPALRKVRVFGAITNRQLSELLDLITDKKTLRVISIQDCDVITRIVSSFPDGLSRLEIEGAASLTELPDTLPRYLRHLSVTYAPSIRHLPDSLPSAIRSLDLTGCQNLVTLPQPLPTKLMELITVDCPKIANTDWAVPHSINWLRNMSLELPDDQDLRQQTTNCELSLPDNVAAWQ